MIAMYVATFIIVLYLGNVLGVKMQSYKIKELKSVRGLAHIIPILVVTYIFHLLLTRKYTFSKRLHMIVGYLAYPYKNILAAQTLAFCLDEYFKTHPQAVRTQVKAHLSVNAVKLTPLVHNRIGNCVYA